MVRTRTIRETGEPFDVAAVDDPAVRYTLEPVPRYGRAAAGGRLTRASWSTWSYRVKDHPAAVVEPCGWHEPGERPERFTLDLGPEGPDVLVEADPAEF